jgi:hypothetical protein
MFVMKLTSAFEGGLFGAFALSVIHQILKKYNPDAPHMDDLGMEALSKTLGFAKLPIPEEKKLFLMTLAGDLMVNAAFYSAAGIGDKKQVWLRGILLGLSAGIGGVFLPKPMGLNEDASNRTMQTKILTVGLYLIGGIVASAVMEHLQKKENRRKNK